MKKVRRKNIDKKYKCDCGKDYGSEDSRRNHQKKCKHSHQKQNKKNSNPQENKFENNDKSPKPQRTQTQEINIPIMRSDIQKLINEMQEQIWKHSWIKLSKINIESLAENKINFVSFKQHPKDKPEQIEYLYQSTSM